MLASCPRGLCHDTKDDVLLFTETYLEGEPPVIFGFARCFGAARPRSGVRGARGGVAVYVRDGVHAQLWKQRAADGVLWVSILRERPVLLACCYLPPAGSGGCPAGVDRWYDALAAEVTEARALGAVVVAGDFNSRIAARPDFPEELFWGEDSFLAEDDVAAVSTPRASMDTTVNQHGGLLLQLCKETGLRVTNGRVPGDVPAAPTSLGHQGTGTSVVDLFLVCPQVMPRVRRLEVRGKMAAPLDHMSVHLCLEVTPTQRPPPPPQPVDQDLPPVPLECLREIIVEPEKLDAFVERLHEVVGDLFFAGMLAEGEDAGALDAAALALDNVVIDAAVAVGMRVRNRSKPPGWLRWVQRPPAIRRQVQAARHVRAAREGRRHAVRGCDFAAAEHAREQVRRLLRRERRDMRRAGGAKRLEALLRSDPKEFYRHYRKRAPPPPSSISPAEFGRHFQQLLGGIPPDLPVPPLAAGALPPAAEALGLSQELFTVEELGSALHKVRNGSAVLGVFQPQLLKAAAEVLLPSLVLCCNACVRRGRLPTAWALSAITAIPKGGSDPFTCDGYRGISVGTLFAKLYASAVDQRMSAWAEVAGVRAEGQFGFRRGRGCQHAGFVLRALIDDSRSAGDKLFVCFVDFRKAYDSVPRHLLWAKLERRGVTGWVLDAVKALYANVPMCVKTSAGLSGCFQATMGVKQGCPLSPLLFGMYLDDLEGELAAGQHGMDFPLLSGSPVH